MKKKQKAAYEFEKKQQNDAHDSIPGPKEKFMFPEFKVNAEGLRIIKDRYAPEKKKIHETFLSDSTAKGLRITCKSTITLSKHLLSNCGFQYVLTRKLNQDCIEVLFIINDYFVNMQFGEKRIIWTKNANF